MVIDLHRVEVAFERLSHWMGERQFVGTDPYDLKPLWLYRKTRALPWPLGRAFSRIWRFLERSAPRATRALLGVRPKANPYTFALAARAHLAVAESTRDSGHLETARECLDWLLAHPGERMGNGKLAWGYPFTWYAGPDSCEIIPPRTPLSVISNEAGHAFMDFADLTGEVAALEPAKQVGRFLTSALNRSETADGGLCFSYGPTDSFQVINTSLGTAAFLARLCSCTRDTEVRHLSRRARLYCRERQNPDGSWGYWGDGAKSIGRIDHHHTAMDLQWLCVCQRYDPLPEDGRALSRGAAFYMERMFDLDGAPRMLPESRFPVNVHSCAQALVTLRHLHDTGEPGALELLRTTLHWVLENMVNPDGSFCYVIDERGVDRTPHMRWGQAWMLWGLANAIVLLPNA